MQDGKETLEECLIEAGFWSEWDGHFTPEECALSIVLERLHQRLGRGILLLFYGPAPGHKEHEARLVWRGQQQMLASGESIADALCNAALALTGFLKKYPEFARPSGASLETT